MASKNLTQKCTQLKGEKALQNKLAQKLQLDLERDIFRLFQDSFYSDIKFAVDSSFVLAHSCILRTRAARFYKFVFAQFEFYEENGVSVFNIYNASFTCLQAFVENIYTNNHSFHAEDSIIKHLQETKTQTLDKTKLKATDSHPVKSAITPDSDLFFTPKCSPSDLQKPFASSKLKIKENDVSSYYKIVVDDIPAEEGKKVNSEEEKLLEKELAEQDELLSSFQIIFSKKSKNKPSSLSLGTSSQSAKKAKPKFDRKLDSNLILFDINDRKSYRLPHWKPNPISDKYLGVKAKKKDLNLQEKTDTESYLVDVTNSLGGSDMDVSTTGFDSGLDNSSICQQETSPKENTVSETSGVDLTEAAINEEIPIDEATSKQSSESPVSSEAGTWDVNDDLKNKSPVIVDSTSTIDNDQNDFVADKEEMTENNIFPDIKKYMKDCETFLFMERQGSFNDVSDRKNSITNVPDSLCDDMLKTEETDQYANEIEADSQTYDGEKNYYIYKIINDKNSDDINPTEAYENLDVNETVQKGVSSDVINSNFEYYSQPDILRDVQETKTPPCTPKKLKSESKENQNSQPETRPVSWENNNSTGVSNYFIDASSLLDDDEIISPPISLNCKPSVCLSEETKSVEEEPQILCKKVVTNFYSPDSSNDVVSYQRENEKRQGEYIFRNSIPHYSKHEVEENQVSDSSDRFRRGADHFKSEGVDEESEQVVPSADIVCSPTMSSISRQNTVECDYSGNDFFEPPPEYESKSPDDHADGNKSESRLEAKDVSSSSVCSESPSLRRRNELTPILSGGMDFVEEEKNKQKKSSQAQGEAWIVTFDDTKKPRNRFTSSETGSESGEDIKTIHLGQGRSRRMDEKIIEVKPEKPGPKLFPVEKSSSLGYFIDFGKENAPEPVQQEPEIKPEKKNMFSMFIGIDDESAPRKPKPVLERENTFDKTPKESAKNESVNQDEGKKPFFMFIESDTKRKQPPKRAAKHESEAADPRKTYLRTQSYTVRRDSNDQTNPEVKTDMESSSDSSLPYSETSTKTNRSKGKLPLPLNKFRSSALQDTKITAWADTKQSSDDSVSSESWLRSKDVQVNYKGKNNEVYLKKDSTFVMGNEYKDKFNKSKYKEGAKPAERDSGVILSDKGDDSFVRLSDLDSFDLQTKPKERMSQSTPEDCQKNLPENTNLSKSIESEGKITSRTSCDKKASQSLSRLFPNLSAQSLAYIARKDGDKNEVDIQASETSEISSSMQSSMEPVGLEISTSETDVSTHGGATSRLGEDLLKMFLEEISPDVVVEVNGRRIKAHKCVLASRCQYFASKLSGGWVESAGNVISLQGFDPECYETGEERDILSDTKTKFVPPKYLCASPKNRRKSRVTYEPITYETVYGQLLDRRKRRRLRRIQMTYLKDFLDKNLERQKLNQSKKKYAKYGKRVVSKNKKKYKKRTEPWFDIEQDNKIFRLIEDDIDREKQLPGEGEEDEQINLRSNYKSWLLNRNQNSGEREVFHAFWKGEGNSRSIRKAQTKMMLSFMDPTVDPCQDFYQFACGNWGHKNPIPKDKAGYDTFEMLRESLDIVLQDLLMEEENDTTNEAAIKTKNLYRSCMNSKILEQRREKPLLDLLENLGGWPMIDPNWKGENFDWIVLMAKLRLYNNDILISEWVGPDIKNSDEYIIQFDQTSLGLPTREYFLEPGNYVYLEAYKNYLIKISTLLGSSLENAKAQAEDLMIFETALAEITSSPDERRNVSELYERMTVSELSETVPEINWVRYLTIVLNREVDPQEPVVMFALRYVQDLVKLLCQTEPRVVSNYLLWRFIRHRVNNLDDRFQEAKQHFYYVLFGREEAPPRWKNCVAQVNTNMGMGLGAMFVSRYFDEKSKNDTLEMTHDIMRSFRQILNHTSWIDDDTKRLAIQKVDAMMLRIGYPDFILNKEALNERYAEVQIDPELYFENTLNILKHLTRAEQDRLGTRVNKSMWNTPPAVVNAYYSRNKNQIMFPAGILQPPFYHRYFPRSLNYGGIGVVIGHEITHGFDDKGRLFDQNGNLHKWWKEPAIEAFHERAQCLIDQYSKYTVTEVAMQIDGVNTQGENIADNGGIKQAFKAYENWLAVHGDKDEVLQGINATNLQLFFLNFAQIWCGTMRPEATKNKLKTAVHSPGKFRVIGTLSNSEDFARVYQCEPGSPMNPFKKCSVWFSYNAVHFALRYIYSGESRIPESLNIVELATLADKLCLDGLQEIISYNLKVKYCHSFHVPCSVCSVGVLDCLPVAAAYGLDDLYRKCLRWITKYFVKIWPTKTFGNLPKELLEKCYQHYIVHMTVDNVLDTIISIDKVQGSLPNVRWTEPVSRLVKKLHDATIRYIAEHFSSILTSDNFLALGKEEGWSVSRLEDSLMEAIRYLPPEQACWSHARLHRILSVAAEPDPPPEMNWNEDFLKLLQVIAELVEHSLIRQAPRAAKSKAWRQMEPELRSRIQEAACLVLPDPEPSPTYRRSNYTKREVIQRQIPQTTKSRNLEIRQIKLAMTQQANKSLNPSRPLSLQIDQRPKKDSRFLPLRLSVSTSSVRKPEPSSTEGIRKTQSRSHIVGSTTEPKKTFNPRYSDVKSRYLEPRSPQKSASEKAVSDSSHRRAVKNYVSSSDSSRNCSPAFRSSNCRSSIPQVRKVNAEANKQSKPYVLRSGSAATLSNKRDRSHSNTTPSKTLSRLIGEENMSSDSLFTDSLLSEKEATVRRKPGKENLEDNKKFGNLVNKSASSSPIAKRQGLENRATKTSASRKLIVPKSSNEIKCNPPKRYTTGKTPAGNLTKTNAPSSRAMTANRNQKNSNKIDSNLVNGNSNRRRVEVDSENNKKTSKEPQPAGVERSGTFLKEEPTILKKPPKDTVESEV